MKESNQGALIIKTVVVGLLSLLFILPLVWMLLASLKTAPEVFSYPYKWLPKVWQWKNYATIWTSTEMPMTNALYNTVFIVIFSTVGQLIISSFAAYAFARINFKGKGFIFMLFLSSMMIPGQVTIIPRYMLFKTINLYNSLWAIILPAWFGATAIFLLRQFYIGLPDDLMEAAKIDGAGHMRIFLQIMMPLTKSALVSLFILSFISSWNEYLGPLIFLTRPEKYTMSQSIRWYMLDEFKQHNLTMAAASSAILPILVIFVFCQRYFVEGIATAGVKG